MGLKKGGGLKPTLQSRYWMLPPKVSSLRYEILDAPPKVSSLRYEILDASAFAEATADKRCSILSFRFSGPEFCQQITGVRVILV